MWYADPSEPGTIGELRCAGFRVQAAVNEALWKRIC